MAQEKKDVLITRQDGTKFFLGYDGIDAYTGLKKYILGNNMEQTKDKWEKLTIFSDGPGLDFNAISNEPEYLAVLANELLSKERIQEKINLAEQLTGQGQNIFIAHVGKKIGEQQYRKLYTTEDRKNISKN